MAGALDDLLRTGRPARGIAAEFSISYDALCRHARNHLTRRAGGTYVPPSPASDDPLDELVAALRVRALAGNPSDTREYRLALAAQQDVRHAAPPVRDLADEPEWHALRTKLLHALEPFPEARIAVADALAGMDS
ncbi:MAG TPA: hypothetical protein VIK08_00630 [Candidatus Limnocylindrales bacterium]